MRELKDFYVTFGASTVFGNHYARFRAFDESIVRAFCNKNYKGIWASVYETPPWGPGIELQVLNSKPVDLYYASAEHVR